MRSPHAVGSTRGLSMQPVGELDGLIGQSGSMSEDGKRGVAEWPKLPRPSLTLLPRLAGSSG